MKLTNEFFILPKKANIVTYFLTLTQWQSIITSYSALFGDSRGQNDEIGDQNEKKEENVDLQSELIVDIQDDLIDKRSQTSSIEENPYEMTLTETIEASK